MRVVKSISLPVKLAEEAEKLPNLSKFVQDCIKEGVKGERLALEAHFEARGRRIAVLHSHLTNIIKLSRPGSKLHQYHRIVKYVKESEDLDLMDIMERFE